MKENFAQILNSRHYAEMKAIIQAETNENRLIRDYACFKQTPEHKDKVKEEKWKFREHLKSLGIPKRQYKWKILGKA